MAHEAHGISGAPQSSVALKGRASCGSRHSEVAPQEGSEHSDSTQTILVNLSVGSESTLRAFEPESGASSSASLSSPWDKRQKTRAAENTDGVKKERVKTMVRR